MIDPHFQKVFLLALGIKDPWYIKSLDMVPSAKNPEILEMRVEVDLLEGSKALKTSTTVYIRKRKKMHERMMIPFLRSVSAPFTLEKIQERRSGDEDK